MAAAVVADWKPMKSSNDNLLSFIVSLRLRGSLSLSSNRKQLGQFRVPNDEPKVIFYSISRVDSNAPNVTNVKHLNLLPGRAGGPDQLGSANSAHVNQINTYINNTLHSTQPARSFVYLCRPTSGRPASQRGQPVATIWKWPSLYSNFAKVNKQSVSSDVSSARVLFSRQTSARLATLAAATHRRLIDWLAGWVLAAAATSEMTTTTSAPLPGASKGSPICFCAARQLDGSARDSRLAPLGPPGERKRPRQARLMGTVMEFACRRGV